MKWFWIQGRRMRLFAWLLFLLGGLEGISAPALPFPFPPLLPNQISPELEQKVQETFAHTVPKILYDSAWIPLQGGWKLRLRLQQKGSPWVKHWDTSQGKMGAYLLLLIQIELNFSKVAYFATLPHPQRKVWKALLGKYRADDPDLLDFKHHEPLKGECTIMLKAYPDLLGPEYIHHRTRIEDIWFGQVKPYANFWHIDLKTFAGNRVRHHLQHFANSIADTLRRDPSLWVGRESKKFKEFGQIYDLPVDNSTEMPFRIRSKKEVRNLKPTKKVPIDFKGTWKVKIWSRPDHGNWGEYKLDLTFDLDAHGGLSNLRIHCIQIVRSIYKDPQQVEEQLAEAWETWCQMRGYNASMLQWTQVEDPFVDYYVEIKGHRPKDDYILPVIVRSPKRIYLLWIHDFGDLILVPLKKIA